MTSGSVLTFAAIVARAAGGARTVRATLLALSILVGLVGCATSHGPGAPAGDSGVAPDADTPPEDGGAPAPEPDGGDRDLDGDGYPASVDCNDRDATIHPGAMEEQCFLDGIDSNCDGWDLDEECESSPECLMWLCNG
jgi:hypothetical protein